MANAFCRTFVVTIDEWSLVTGFILLKSIGLHSCYVALIQGLVQGGQYSGFSLYIERTKMQNEGCMVWLKVHSAISE